MKTKEEIFNLIMSEPDESALIVELSEQIDQQFKRIEELKDALRGMVVLFAGVYSPYMVTSEELGPYRRAKALLQ